MLRLCARSTYAQYKSVFQSIQHGELTIKLKCVSVLPNTLTRHFASKIKDDNKLERIYYGPLSPQIRAVKVFSLTSSAAGLLAQPIIIRESASIGSTSLLVTICCIVGFFTFITPILLHIITKKYVTEIYYDPATSTYKATTINFFLYPKVLEFKVDDVDVPEIPGMFTTMNVKGKPLFVEARHFYDPSHYAKMMGYDKPMDFKLGDQAQDTSNK